MMDTVHVINLPKREDRLLSFCNQMRIIAAPFQIWSGIEGNLTPAQNINIAHKQVIKYAKENNLPRCIVSEDDCVFTHPDSYKYFLSQIPDSYDLFFGMLYAAEIKDNKVLNGFSGLTLYCVSERFYDYFLSTPDNVHLDRNLGMVCHEKEYYVCAPYICKQSGGYSDNMREHMNYRVYEEKMTFYNG